MGYRDVFYGGVIPGCFMISQFMECSTFTSYYLIRQSLKLTVMRNSSGYENLRRNSKVIIMFKQNNSHDN